MPIPTLRRLFIASVFALFAATGSARAQQILIPMDLVQTDHLKAYGVAYYSLTRGQSVEWLLNYRSGSFLLTADQDLIDSCNVRGVVYEIIAPAEVASIYDVIEQGNMEVVLLEKAPRIAIYTPPNKQPWDDAVTLALTYAQVEYETLWDAEVLLGKLPDYDWLHLHHEDFTGQYGKFYASYRTAPWYLYDVQTNETMAHELGYLKVSKLKLAVAETIRQYVEDGGFLFAMCSAPETIDIALSANETDIVPQPFDGDPIDGDAFDRLEYSRTFAFRRFAPSFDPFEYKHSDIDTTPDRTARRMSPEGDYFTLFEFSAKLDPVPTMLVQCHVPVVDGFMGQTTAFRKHLVKKHVTILGENEGQDEVRYIHGNLGRGTFTFYGGHDPEDYQHLIHDPPTDLNLHKSSPGYRLILNNVLFPAARKKERKT